LGLDGEINIGSDEVVRLAGGEHVADEDRGFGRRDVVEGHAEDGDGRDWPDTFLVRWRRSC
jgi:hypothetical protein